MDSSVCPICRDEIEYFSYGPCDHPTCLRCAVKLRRFGSSDDPNHSNCPTCRAGLLKVIIMKKFVPYSSVDKSGLIQEDELDFLFEDESIFCFYKKLMDCICPTCGYKANSMAALNRHTTNEHRLSFCDLCLRFAHMLPSEFVPLSSQELIAHRKWDSVKKRGHPLCEFCNQTFYEFENLVGHIREAHFLCDFCHASGVFEVFRHQRELFNHYKEAHFVCPECETMGRMSCFPSQDQLGMHRLREHPNESKGDPTLWEPLQIRYSTQGLIGPNQRGRNSGRRGHNDARGGGEEEGLLLYYHSPPRGPMPEEWTATDFPSLTGENATAERSSDAAERSEVDQRAISTTVAGRHTRSHAAVVGGGVTHNLDDFPSLPSASASNDSSNIPTPQLRWVDASKTKSSTQASQKRGAGHLRQTVPGDSDFPSLAGASSSTSHAPPANWGAAPFHVASKMKEIKRQPTVADFPPLTSDPTASSHANNHRILPESRLTSYVPPSAKHSGKPKNSKGATHSRPVEHISPPAPDLQPFSSALLKAKKNSWWNEADNDGALSKLIKSDSEDGEKLAPPTYSRIQTVDYFPSEEKNVSSNSLAPPQFSAQDFPSLGGDTKSSEARIPTTSKAGNVDKKPKSKKEVQKAKSSPPQTPTKSKLGKKNSSNNQNIEQAKDVKNLDSLEDTETVIFKENVYTPPPDYEAKNHAVIEMAQKIFSSEGHTKNAFSRFASLSRLFRHGQLSAQAYLEALVCLLSAKDDTTQTDWLSSMLALLPDVGLQRALLRALKGDAAPRIPYVATPARCRGSNPPEWAKGVVASLQVCSFCGQVCQRSGIREHVQVAHG